MDQEFWPIFAIAAAFFQATRIAVTKKISFDFSSKLLTLYINIINLVITVPLVFWYSNFPIHNLTYLSALFGGTLFSSIGAWSLNYAIKSGEISIVGPLMSFTPGFIVLLEWFTLGVHPSTIGFLGIFILMTSAFIINTKSVSWKESVRLFITSSGSLHTLIASFCFAAATLFGRVGILESDPLSFTVMIALVNPVMLFFIFSVQSRQFISELRHTRVLHQLPILFLLGILFALMRLADQIALSMTLASYAYSVKRISGLFSVLFGFYFYHEKHTSRKLLGSLLMILGLALITMKTVGEWVMGNLLEYDILQYIQ